MSSSTGAVQIVSLLVLPSRFINTSLLCAEYEDTVIECQLSSDDYNAMMCDSLDHKWSLDVDLSNFRQREPHGMRPQATVIFLSR